MAKIRENPGARPGATGVGMTFKAGELNVTLTDSAFPDALHHALRIRRLHLRYGLTGLVAARIAALAFEEGAR